MKLPAGFRIDEASYALIRAIAPFWDTTTANGNVAGTTLVCAALANEPSYVNNIILLASDVCAGQSRIVTSHVGNTITVNRAFTTPAGAVFQVIQGTQFIILSISDETGIYARLIFDLLNAIFTLKETGGTITTDGTEQDVYRNDTPMGVFLPKTVQIDMSNNAAGDTVVVRVYYRIVNGGNLRLKDQASYVGAVNPPLINVELEPNRHGIRVTLQRTAGVQRDYDWCAFYED